MKRYWLKLNFLFLITVALVGTIMRSVFTGMTTDLNYQFALHTHSHTGFIGWVYQSLFFALVTLYLPTETIRRGRYALQLGITMALSAAMTVSFWQQGYGAISIALSSIFQIVSYWFVWRLWQDGKQHRETDHSYSWRFVEMALITLFVSTFGPWGLAVISANGLQGTSLYSVAIYFYLHFQYNGWFIFGILALFLFAVEKKSGKIEQPLANSAFIALAVSIFPAFVLSVIYLEKTLLVYAIAILSGVTQLAGIAMLYSWLGKSNRRFSEIFPNFWSRLLVSLAGVALLLKFVFQLLSIVPGLDDIAFENRNVIIAYIHLVVLGIITFGLIGILAQQHWMNLTSKISQIGTTALIAGFVTTEYLLVSPAFGVVHIQMFTGLFYAGIAMLSGIVLVWLAQFPTARQP
ncbi:MAG: hypothetical protein R3C41_20575 [Calditrichia bacterium]